MRVVIDTNIVMDVLANRLPFVYYSELIFELAAKNKIRAAITANTVTDIAYLLGKHCHDVRTVKNSLASLMNLFDVIEVSKETCLRAMALAMDDYEDAVLAECAQQWGAELIISRNLKDFINSPIAAVEPEKFLKQHNPN